MHNVLLVYKQLEMQFDESGKLTENRIIVADYNDNYYRDFNCQKAIPKAEYDKISQKYYAENAYKEIKWKPISDFK